MTHRRLATIAALLIIPTLSACASDPYSYSYRRGSYYNHNYYNSGYGYSGRYASCGYGSSDPLGDAILLGLVVGVWGIASVVDWIIEECGWK